jgi:uncharacterized SAM-binding protein YcdF (DUF218 family)
VAKAATPNVTDRRLIAVLGYSDGRTRDLHAVCAARLARAVEEARAGDAVLLSGWARRRRPESEAELMRRAWNGVADHVLVDDGARTTYGNVLRAAAAARELAVREVVLVTSGWHRRRASALLRLALRGSGRRVTVLASQDRGTIARRLRELACWALAPLQVALAARRR